MIDFLICYEHTVREIENDALIKWELQRRGYSCEIIGWDDYDYVMHSLTNNKARVVVVPWLRYNENVLRYLKIAKKPIKIVNLQCEQIGTMESAKRNIADIEKESLKGYHLCWGENSYNKLLRYGVEKDNLFITGAVQQDFGRKTFRYYFRNKLSMAKNFGLSENKRWVLFISSFQHIEYNEYEELYRGENKYAQEKYIIDEKSFHEIIKWINSILKELDCEFIYRPHPSEGETDELKRLVNKYSNFHIISELSVKQWAVVCDKVNLWASTSNVELTAMDIDYAIVRPIKVPYKFDMESLVYEDKIETYNEFLQYNMSNEKRRGLIEKRKKNIDKICDYDIDIPAYIRVADRLEKLLIDPDASVRFSFQIKERLLFELLFIKSIVRAVCIRLYNKNQFVNRISKVVLPSFRTDFFDMQIHLKKEAIALEKRIFKYMDRVSMVRKE